VDFEIIGDAMRYRVLVRLKEGVLDVQGKAIENGLRDKSYEEVSNVRVGRMVELDVSDLSPSDAQAKVEALCKELLANPVIEDYTISEVA
jgi:phosphoribosylformylglycinamidine synthase PurS subunit